MKKELTTICAADTKTKRYKTVGNCITMLGCGVNLYKCVTTFGHLVWRSV